MYFFMALMDFNGMEREANIFLLCDKEINKQGCERGFWFDQSRSW